MMHGTTNGRYYHYDRQLENFGGSKYVHEMPVRPFGKARLEEMYRKFDCLSKVAEERI
jgi:hypothetical protein